MRDVLEAPLAVHISRSFDNSAEDQKISSFRVSKLNLAKISIASCVLIVPPILLPDTTPPRDEVMSQTGEAKCSRSTFKCKVQFSYSSLGMLRRPARFYVSGQSSIIGRHRPHPSLPTGHAWPCFRFSAYDRQYTPPYTI